MNPAGAGFASSVFFAAQSLSSAPGVSSAGVLEVSRVGQPIRQSTGMTWCGPVRRGTGLVTLYV